MPDAGAPTRLVEIFVYSSARAEEVGIAGTPESVIPLTRRIPVTTTPIKDTIELLLSDPLTDAERAAGYFTNFPHEGFVLEDINLEPDGTLILRFPDLPGFTTGGSAHTSVLQATIERTALQFDEVERVEGFTFSP
ncbi:MAG: GerMN domain-containing protein [Actinomycetota bacterium]